MSRGFVVRLDSEMLPDYDNFLIKRFEHPDEVRTFEKGKFEIVKIGSMTIGRASYPPSPRLRRGRRGFDNCDGYRCAINLAT